MKKQDDKPMLGAEFTHEITNVSKIFGREHDINVIIEGDMAGVTENGDIVYPSIPTDKHLSEHEIRVSRGYVDHECGHKRHTDLPAFFEFGRKCKAEGKGLLMGIANALEDPRMEAKVIENYAGAIDNLTATANEVSRSWTDAHFDAAQACRENDTRHDQWHHFVGGALSILGRKSCWGFQGHDYFEASAVFDALLGDEIYDKCLKTVQKLARCKNTHDVLKLAEEVGEWIVEEAEKDQQQQQAPQDQANADQDGQDQDGQGQDQQDGDGQDGQGQDQGADDQDGQGQDQQGQQSQDSSGQSRSASGGDGRDQDQDDQGQGQGQDANGQGQDQQSQSSNGSTGKIGDEGDPLNDKGHTVDVKDALNKTLQNRTKGNGAENYKPYSTQYDRWHTRKCNKSAVDRRMNQTAGLASYKELLSESAGKLNVVRRTLERALQADRNNLWNGGHAYGRLDSRRLVAAFNRQEKVYKRKEEAPAIDTAVTFLLDMSYSMCFGKIETATQALICMAEALEKTQVSYNIIGHSIGMDRGATKKMQDSFRKRAEDEGLGPNDYSRRYSRVSPVDMFEFKSFNERLVKAKNAVGNAVSIVNNGVQTNGNADSEALWHVYRILERQPETKKVIIVLSDGCPNTCLRHTAAIGERALRESVAEIESRGVTIIGIGICSDEGRSIYENWFEVYRMEELAETVIDQIAQALLGRHVKADKGVSV